MTNSEKALYHQIHPVKLAADILAAIISLRFFWYHRLLIGLAIHIGMPIAGSLLVMRYANLEPVKASPLGRYVAKYMGAIPQAARLCGDIMMSVGA